MLCVNTIRLVLLLVCVITFSVLVTHRDTCLCYSIPFNPNLYLQNHILQITDVQLQNFYLLTIEWKKQCFYVPTGRTRQVLRYQLQP